LKICFKAARRRSAKRVGDDQVAVVKACIAAEAKSAKAEALLDAVSTDARMDLGYILCRLHWLMRNDTPGSNLHGRIVTPKKDVAAAVKLMLAASPEDLRRQDTDEWWRERRALARKLIDLDDAGLTSFQAGVFPVHPASAAAPTPERAAALGDRSIDRLRRRSRRQSGTVIPSAFAVFKFYLPALALGPIIESLQLSSGTLN
jgi:hypothetical protein